jgi:hypothetical protein
MLRGIMTDTAIAGTFRLADVFGTTVAMYSRRFTPFIALTLIASIPNYVILFAIEGPTEWNFASIVASVGLGLLILVTQSLASAVVMYGVIQELRGRAFSIADALQAAFRRLLPILGVAICTAAASSLGALALVIPGIILTCMFYVSMPACIAEQIGVFASMSRSSFLTEGHRWQVFGMLLLIGVVGKVLDSIAGMVFAPAGHIGTLIGEQVPAVIVDSFDGVLIGVLYYKLRVTKEGVDIDKIASVFD